MPKSRNSRRHEQVHEMRATEDGSNLDGMSPRRPPAHGLFYEITDDLIRNLRELMKRPEFRSQRLVAEDLAKHIGKPVDPSTISNILRRRHPSSHLAYALADRHKWPLPPVARMEEAMVTSEQQAMLEELASIAPDRFRSAMDIVSGFLDQARGEQRVVRALNGIRETAVRDGRPSGEDEDG